MKRKTEPTAFEKIVHEALGYNVGEQIKLEWTIGGITGGGYWGGTPDIPLSGEMEPEFQELDKILEIVCPAITFLQHRKLMREIVVSDTNTHYEYYGNSTTYATKTVKLADLEMFLLVNGLWKPEER